VKTTTQCPKQFFTRKELAETLNVSVSTVSRGEKSGQWPYNKCTRIGRRIVYSCRLLEEVQEKALGLEKNKNK
jgi:predicted transcriptional regulator